MRYFSASVSLPVIFCSLTGLPRLTYFVANAITATRSLFEKRKDAMESLVPVQGQYISADQPKPKRLLHCCSYKTEPEQAVDRRFWSRGSQQRCKFVSKGRSYSMAAFLNIRIRELIQ